MYYRLYLGLGKHENKAEGDIQIQDILIKLGSIAVFSYPTRKNMSYKLNVNICHGNMKSHPRTIQGTK